MFDVQKDPTTAALNHSLCCISLDILWSCNRLPVISKKISKLKTTTLSQLSLYQHFVWQDKYPDITTENSYL